MAFNTYINGRLNQWAAWTLQRVGGGLGYPHQCAFTRMAGDGAGYSSRVAPDVNERAWEIEKAVQALRAELKECIIVFYCKPGTVEQKLRDCHCSRFTLYARLDRAHAMILDALNEFACEDEQQPAMRYFAEQVAETA